MTAVTLCDQLFWQEFLRREFYPDLAGQSPVPLAWLGMFTVLMAVSAIAVARGQHKYVWLSVIGMLALAWVLRQGGVGYPLGLPVFALLITAFVWVTPWLERRSARRR